MDGTAAILSNLLSDKRGRKTVCVQGLGFVGAANAIAIASARDGAGDPLYNVVGVDLPTASGRERAAALNQGAFPFATTDAALVAAAQSARIAGNLVAVTDASAERTPNRRASYDAVVTTARGPLPATITGRPRSVGRRRSSTDT